MTSSPEAPSRPRTGLVDGLRRYGPILRAKGVGGALGFSVVGRLHESMISFGVIMLVTHRSTYAAAGVVMAAFGTGGLVAGPVNSRLAARFGHRRVLLPAATLYAGAVVAMAAAGDHLVTLGVLSAVAGLATPPLTPALRSTLPRLVRPDQRIQAFALESTLQEVIFISGPVLAGAIAAVAGPRAALVAAAAATLVGTVGYCWSVRERTPHGPEQGDRDRSTGASDAAQDAPATRLLRPVVLRTLAGGVGFLAVLSIVAVALIAHVSGPQAHGVAGVLLGLTSLGSMGGGLVFGARALPSSSLRLRFGVLATGIVVLAVVFVSRPGGSGGGAVGAVLLGAAALAYGATIAPLATVLFGRLSDEAGDGRSTEAFGWMGAAMGIGGVIGDASGGWLVTTTSPWVAALVAAAVAITTASVVPRRVATPAGTFA